jgi:predicted MFS family arabinose efflux permease
MLLSVATFLMGQSNNYSELVFSLILFVTGEMFVMANMLEIADQLGGNKHTALGIGFSQAAFYTGLMCGPVAAGCSMHIFGTQSAWLISALLCLLSMIFVFPLMNPKAVQIKELS